jgi:DNA-binding response OmpR family regulator
MKILIVEDDQLVANIYRNKIALEGYEVEVALDGHVGIELLRSFKPDAVILDLMLPKMTGVELMRLIRAEPGFDRTPLIVFSNTYLTSMVEEAWKLGATKCLSKSNCTPKQVIEVLRITLGGNGPRPPVPEKATAGSKTAQAPGRPVPEHKAHGAVHSPPQPAHTSRPADQDAQFQNQLRKTLIESLPSTLANARGLLSALAKADNESARIKQANDLYRRIHGLTSNAGLSGLTQIAQMSEVLEALLKELYEKPKNINASTLRTVATALDSLGILQKRTALPENPIREPQVLVVDDEAISRRAIAFALDKAKLKSTCVEDPQAAYNLLKDGKFDLVFLDVDMPGMNGFELCTKLRALPAYKSTPVVFVTNLTDFESRTNSTMSGGNDFIAKPFLFMELAVKALVYVLRGRLGPA